MDGCMYDGIMYVMMYVRVCRAVGRRVDVLCCSCISLQSAVCSLGTNQFCWCCLQKEGRLTGFVLFVCCRPVAPIWLRHRSEQLRVPSYRKSNWLSLPLSLIPVGAVPLPGRPLGVYYCCPF